jgi:hypothetical protein
MALNPAIEFKTPEPPAQRWDAQVDWDAVVVACKGKPTEWALVGNYSSGVAAHIRAGRYKQFHPHGDDTEAAKRYMKKHWEVTIRKCKDDSGLYETYIRWMR